MDIKHIAKLAQLPVSADEEKKLAKQLSDTVDYIDHLKTIKIKNASPTAQVTGKTNQFREDDIIPCLSTEDALKNAKKTQKNFFVSTVVWE